jgi:very-short-patch-repair endonuclease
MRSEPTAAEKELWLQLRERRLDGLRFRRQYAIERFVLDFFCAEARLAVELDGSIHDAQVERDAARTAVLGQHRIHVIRFTNEQIFADMPSVLAQIAAAARPPRHEPSP